MKALQIWTTSNGIISTFHGRVDAGNIISGGYHQVLRAFEDQGINKILKDGKEIDWSARFI